MSKVTRRLRGPKTPSWSKKASLALCVRFWCIRETFQRKVNYASPGLELRECV